MAWYQWPPYVPVSERRARAKRAIVRLRKKGLRVEPVEIEGRQIARTFWGRAWCQHLESYQDFAYRLQRGRAYVKHGAVCHLEIAAGAVRANVMGSELYEVEVEIKKLPAARWRAVKARCAGGIASLLELLEGRLSKEIMAVVTDRDDGLFPPPRSISLACTCPDHASMCKHVAAVLYGVGARLDRQPELLFVLRGVDHQELIATDADVAVAGVVGAGGSGRRIARGDLADVFGIDLAETSAGRESSDIEPSSSPTKRRGTARRSKRKRKRTPERRPDVARARTGPTGPKTRNGRKRAQARPGPARSRRPTGKPPARGFTGAGVERLRRRLDLSRAEFASLLGVSPAAVGVWERTSGALNLRARSREALTGIADLSAAQARRRLYRE